MVSSPCPARPGAVGGSPGCSPGLTGRAPAAENLSFWEACEELRYGGQAQVPALVDSVYQ